MHLEYGYESIFSDVKCIRVIKVMNFGCWDVIGSTITPPVLPYDKKREIKNKRMIKAIDDYYEV